MRTDILALIEDADQNNWTHSDLLDQARTTIGSSSYGSDQEAADVFIDVLEHSDSYWFPSEKKGALALKHSSKVIAGDAVGALHGLVFGPAGSIIEGAVVSIAINEGWYKLRLQ